MLKKISKKTVCWKEMDNLDRKFSAINSYVKYTTEWFEKKP